MRSPPAVKTFPRSAKPGGGGRSFRSRHSGPSEPDAPGLGGGNTLRLTPPPFLLLPPLRGGEEQVGDEIAQQLLALLRLQCGKVFGYFLRQFFQLCLEQFLFRVDRNVWHNHTPCGLYGVYKKVYLFGLCIAVQKIFNNPLISAVSRPIIWL